jgi:ribosomal-protein-alanine N-acetyltransferase
MYGPVIRGKLLTLRPPRAEDAPSMITWFEDLEVTRFLTLQHPPTLESEKEWIEQVGRDPNAVIWVIEVDGRAVGTTGIREINWKDGYGQTGTVIGDRTVWGRGVGRELMQLRCAYAFTQLPLRKLKSAYLEGNEASARAQKAAGYQEVGRWRQDQFVDGMWRDHILTEVLREDWEKVKTV